jgi:hypothetical protein
MRRWPIYPAFTRFHLVGKATPLKIHAKRDAAKSSRESENSMPNMIEASSGNRDSTHATELCVLVDLEARWENLRKVPLPVEEEKAGTQALQSKQKAYDAFQGKLVAYNKRYTPRHVPELLLNNASRLRAWCQRMRDLYLRVEHDPRSHCPVHLLEKAYRWADHLAVRMNKGRANRSAPPATIRAAIEELEALVQWCDALADGAKQAATPELTTPASGVPNTMRSRSELVRASNGDHSMRPPGL